MQGINAGNDIANLVKLLAYWLARGIILPAELVLRRQIGERYLNPMVLMCFGGAIFLARLAGRIGDGETVLLGLIVGAGWIFHGTVRMVAHRRGEYWHSYSEGDSILSMPSLAQRHRDKFGPFSTFDIAKNIIEPLVVALAGLVLFPGGWIASLIVSLGGALPGPSLILWALITAAVMVLYQLYCARVRRSQLLDHLDAQLLLKAHSMAEQAPPKQGMRSSHGVAYLPIASQPGQSRAKIEMTADSSAAVTVGLTGDEPIAESFMELLWDRVDFNYQSARASGKSRPGACLQAISDVFNTLRHSQRPFRERLKK